MFGFNLQQQGNTTDRSNSEQISEQFAQCLFREYSAKLLIGLNTNISNLELEATAATEAKNEALAQKRSKEAIHLKALLETHFSDTFAQTSTTLQQTGAFKLLTEKLPELLTHVVTGGTIDVKVIPSKNGALHLHLTLTCHRGQNEESIDEFESSIFSCSARSSTLFNNRPIVQSASAQSDDTDAVPRF